jgi:hypothetical protein
MKYKKMNYNNIGTTQIKVGDKMLINGVKKEIISITKAYIEEQTKEDTHTTFFVNSITTN